MLLADGGFVTEWLIAFGTLALVVIGLIPLIIANIVSQSRTRFQVEQLWEAHTEMQKTLLRRAAVHSVISERGEFNSPLIPKAGLVPPSLIEMIQPYFIELCRATGRPPYTDRELAFLIDRKYGEEISKKLCIPYKMDSLECLIYIVAELTGKPFKTNL